MSRIQRQAENFVYRYFRKDGYAPDASWAVTIAMGLLAKINA